MHSLELSRFRGRVDAFISSGFQGRFLVVERRLIPES
jgi:hypothetical protein